MTENDSGNPTMAICYDFDGTLAPGNMQDNRFIPNLGLTTNEFWDAVAANTRETQCDPTISYMYVMLRKAQEAGITVRREQMAEWGRNLTYFPGAESWFQRISDYGHQRNVTVRHYVISAGNAEIIEACSIAGNFDRIFASRFLYDKQGQAVWPATTVNFTTKTQYLFRINKGAFDTDDDAINKYVPDSERPVPFQNIVYIGDGETDIPCFRTVKSLGGLSIAVYGGDRAGQLKLQQEDRVNTIAPADYQAGSRLDRIVQTKIDETEKRHALQQIQ